MDEPRRAKLLTESELPTWMKSSTLKDDPRRATLKTLSDDPNLE